MTEQQSLQANDIVQAFRQVYTHIVQRVETALSENTDSTVLARILDEINEYRNLVSQVCRITWEYNQIVLGLINL